MFIHDRLGRRKDATGAIVDLIRVASSSGMGSTHLIGHELGHNLMSIARDAGVITEAQQKELDALFTDKNGKFDEEAFAEAFARELKRAFFETMEKRMADVPPTKAGRALRRVADFIATLARSFAFWRQERGLDPVTGQPLQAGQVLDAFLKRERTAVDEATQVANAARAAEARATQEAMANAPTQTVVDEDGTEVAYHERGDKSNKKASELDSVPKHDGIGEDVLDALDVMLRTEGDTTIYTRRFGDVKIAFGRFFNQVPGLKGKGFLHILEERTGKDNLSVPAAVEVFLRSVEAAVRGKEIRALKQENRYAIDLDGYRAIIADNGDSREFITGYKIFTEAEKKKREQEKKEKEEERSDVETDAIRQSANYDPARYGRLRQEGAERLRERIAQLLAGRQVPKSVEELEQELEDLDIAHYRLLNARKKAEENGASQEEFDALQKDIDDNRAKYKQVAKAKKKLNQQRAKEKKLYGDSNEQRSNHVSGLFTGGPEAYWRPSLAHVGSNSGTRYFGWGLYAANWREGALVYMPEGGAIMEQTWWTHRPAGDESHLLVDGEPLSEENAERVATTIAHLMEEYGVTTQEMNAKFWRGWDDTNMNGDMAYRTVEWFFKVFTDVENPAAAASRALYMHDIDGVKIPMGEETDFDGNPTGKQLANYVSFSDENLRVDRVERVNPETGRLEQVDDPGEERRDHIHVWSGAGQAYDRVDLAYVGSGTGGNNEGRGAYSSGVRGVAQDRYAGYKVDQWKQAQVGEYEIENLPIVYGGKAMRLVDAVRLIRKNMEEQGRVAPNWEESTILTIVNNAEKYLNDNGYLDYDGFRYHIYNLYVTESPYLEFLHNLEKAERIMASPREKRMMYYYIEQFKGGVNEWVDDNIFGRADKEEVRDVYAFTDEYGVVSYYDVEYVQKTYERLKREYEEKKEDIESEQARYEIERKHFESILPEENPIPPEALSLPAVMEQTWFTNRPEGDVSHLISWLDPVTPEQMNWIVEAAEKAGFTEKEIAFLWGRHKKGESTPQGRGVYMRLETIFHSRANNKPLESYTGDEVQTIHDRMVFEYGKLASEFLLTADIDGVRYPVNYRNGSRHGEQGWNYVAFSDEHLRVDHVYEYNPETDDFERKWHESEGGASLRFTETPLGQELVAEAFDAIMGSRVDLLLRPSRYYGNPYETAKRNPRDGLVVEKLGREIDVSEPRGFAAEVSAEISRFGTREGDPTLREIRARCGSKARFYEVLGAVYETAEAVRSGLADVVTGRERAMMENAGLQAADFIKHNATARATALGRKLYLMGREFAWKLYKEDIAAARAEAQAKVREANAKTREAKAQTRNAERREETARNQAYQNRWGLAEERFMREYERALLRHQAARKVSDVREKMQEQVDLLRLREAKKRALERERGVTFTALKATLGVDIPARLRALAGTQEDPFEAAAKLIAEIDDGFDKWVKRDRRDLLDGTEPYTYLNEQGERAYAETMGNVLKAVARDLSYGKLREALLNASDKIARAKPETVRVIAEGKLGRVARVLRLAQNADIVTLANRRIKSALAEANKRLSSANSGMRTRYMTAMRKQAKELIKTMQLAVSAQDNTKASEKKRYAMLAERARLAEELKVIESGKTPDDLAKDETLTDRQHQDAVKLMFLEKFGDLSYTIDPAEVWAKAAEAEAFVVS